MKIVVLGIDHKYQACDPGLKALVTRAVQDYEVTLMAEENRLMSNTVARDVAAAAGTRWLQIDMSIEERIKAGIQQKLEQRLSDDAPIHFDSDGEAYMEPRYAPREDGIREHHWLDRIEDAAEAGTALIVCGFVHLNPFSEKVEKRGHSVIAKLVYPDCVRQLKIELF